MPTEEAKPAEPSSGLPNPDVPQDHSSPSRGSERAPSLLVPAEEAAALLGVHRSTIYDLLGRQELASVKIGRRRLIPRRALDEFIAANLRSGV